jgi:hypothetical protein
MKNRPRFDETRARGRHEDSPPVYQQYLRFPNLVKGGRVEPNRMSDGSRFWYTEGGSEGTDTFADPNADTVVALLDPESGPKTLTDAVPALSDRPVPWQIDATHCSRVVSKTGQALAGLCRCG